MLLTLFFKKCLHLYVCEIFNDLENFFFFHKKDYSQVCFGSKVTNFVKLLQRRLLCFVLFPFYFDYNGHTQVYSIMTFFL